MKDLQTDLGEGNFIFVGSSTDMWAADVPIDWIEHVFRFCNDAPGNTYLFQSKNPARYLDAVFPESEFSNIIFGTTIETNRDYKQMDTAPFGPVPTTHDRAFALSYMFNAKRMVTIEPIMDFDLIDLVYYIEIIKPEWVNIGADSKGHNLPEPSGYKVRDLITALQDKGIDVKQKSNLKRILES
jgi:protein gp37